MRPEGMISKFFMDHKASTDWAARRRIIFIALIWAGIGMSAIIGWAMFNVQTNPLLDTAFINLNGLIGLIFASYVFGSIADDKNKTRAGTATTPDGNSSQAATGPSTQ